MQKLEIKGGRKISGTVEISGSKNATLPILASTILTNKKISISNVPIVVTVPKKHLNSLNIKIVYDSPIPAPINKKDSLFSSLDISIAGITAPIKFPRWGVPVDWTPVKILDIIFNLDKFSFFILKINT